MEINCYNCSTTTPNNEKIYYCPSCLTQLKCKTCSEQLLKGALGCVSCGTFTNVTEIKNQELNQIEFEQKGDSRKFKATFTDNVGHELVATFGGMIGVGIPKKKLFSINQSKSPNTIEIGGGNYQDVIDAELIEDDDLSEALTRIFKIDGDSLIFQTSNFKSKNKLNKEIRIALLTLLGFKYIHNAEEIKRQLLTDVLKKFKLNSTAFRSWIGRSEEIGQKSGSLIFLTPNGLTNAIEVLREVVNPNVTEGIINLSKVTYTKKRVSNEGSGNGDSKKSAKGAKDYILALINENYFSEKRNLGDIVSFIKDNKAVTFKTTDISGIMGKLLGTNGLKRVKGASGIYEYFI